jgi:uncharacterized protein
MLSVELKHLANILDSVGELRNISQQAKKWSTRIHDAIWQTTVSCHKMFTSHPFIPSIQVVNNIFAYETNGRRLPSGKMGIHILL